MYNVQQLCTFCKRYKLDVILLGITYHTELLMGGDTFDTLQFLYYIRLQQQLTLTYVNYWKCRYNQSQEDLIMKNVVVKNDKFRNHKYEMNQNRIKMWKFETEMH